MIERTHLSVVVFFAAVIWGCLLIVDGVAVQLSWMHPFSTVIGVMVLLLSAFDMFFWRLPFLHPWFVSRPILRGTWKATLVSDWSDPVTGTAVGTIHGYMAVHQTFSRLSLRLITAESHSELLGAEILRSEDATYRIVGVYRNEPRLSVRHRSDIHNGAIILQVLGSPAKSLTGHYWTDRESRSRGELTLSDRRPTIVDDRAEADALYSRPWRS